MFHPDSLRSIEPKEASPPSAEAVKAIESLHLDLDGGGVYFDCKELIVTDCQAIAEAARVLQAKSTFERVGFHNGSDKTELTLTEIIDVYTQPTTASFMTAAEHQIDIGHRVDGEIVSFLAAHKHTMGLETEDLGTEG